MAIVRRKLRSGKVTYWVKFTFRGKDVWERSGTNERDAIALDNRRKREVSNGTYTRERKGRTSVGAWFADWFRARTNRTVDNDRSLVNRHVLSREWFRDLDVQELHRSKHLLRLVDEMKKDGKLGGKSIATVVGIVMQGIRSAKIAELVPALPEIPKGTLQRKTAPANKRKPYQRDDIRRILDCSALPPDQRMFVALAFFTGMREGEICGRRWKDWDVRARPLTALLVHSQYDDQPLKGDERDMTRPRLVPVHNDLALLLRDWWLSGFEMLYCRKPTREDFIIPSRVGGNHTKSSGYKLFQRALVTTGVPNLSLHSTRHAFISIARSCGAPKDVLERVTHNASGETIDDYTTFEWRALCDAVARFSVDSPVDPIQELALFAAPEPGLEPASNRLLTRGIERNRPEASGNNEPAFARENAGDDAFRDARHQLTPAHLAIAFLGVTRRAELRATALAVRS